MARPENPKTLLAERLVAARKALGYDIRKDMAQVLGMKSDTLGTYERGDREPDSVFYTRYHKEFGVNLNWLFAGNGPMLVTGENLEDVLQLKVEILEKVAQTVSQCYQEAGIAILPEQMVVESLQLYNDLMKRVQDTEDQKEIDMLLPHMKFNLDKKIKQA